MTPLNKAKSIDEILDEFGHEAANGVNRERTVRKYKALLQALIKEADPTKADDGTVIMAQPAYFAGVKAYGERLDQLFNNKEELGE